MSLPKRIKHVRELSGISLKKFCERHNLNFSTWSKIEIGQSVLSQKSSDRFIEAARLEGILVNSTWIHEGNGEEPYKIDGLMNPSDDSFREFSIQRMATNFIKFFPNAVTLTIDDDSCFPEFFENDIVGGTKIDLSALPIIKMREEKFIVQLEDRSLVLRLIDKVNEDLTVNLRTINKYPTAFDYIEKNRKVLSLYSLSFILRKSLIDF